jgi:hypothetical protein
VSSRSKTSPAERANDFAALRGTMQGGDKFIATSWILFQSAQALYGA